MSTFSFLFLCVQTCLSQNLYGNYLGRPGFFGPGLVEPGFVPPGFGYGVPGIGYDVPAFIPPGYEYDIGPYDGFGIGNLGVDYDLPFGGVGEVVTDVPIVNGLDIGGGITDIGYGSAAGAVTIAGSCGCVAVLPTCTDLTIVLSPENRIIA